MTITIPLWVSVTYLVIGVTTFLPLSEIAYRQTAPPKPTRRTELRRLLRKPRAVVVQIVMWPAAIRELLR